MIEGRSRPATTWKRDLRGGRPFWLSRPIIPVPHAPLLRDIDTEILVVGAGISGALVAEALSVHHKVAVIDRRGPVKGSTPASTALVEYEIDMPLIHLARKIGKSEAERVWRRSWLAVSALAARTRALGIRCDAVRRDSLYLAGTTLDADGLRAEGEARRAIGIESQFLSRSALATRFGIRRDGALLAYDDMAVDPRRLAAGYLRKAVSRGARVFTPVEASGIETGRRGAAVRTAGGPIIRAQTVVYCTGYELPDFVPAGGHFLSSTFALTTRPQPGRLWPGLCLIWEASDPYLYLRATPDGRVMCGGEDEDFADATARDALIPTKIAAIRRKLGRLLPGIDTRDEFAWAGTFGGSETGLPSIGRVPGMNHVWAVLGFGGNGITYSRVAADIVSGALDRHPDPDADLFAFAPTGKN